MAALHNAFGVTTELFASPLNVHPDTQHYYSAYAADTLFGARYNAYAAPTKSLGADGAVAFNPEYEGEELLRAVQRMLTAARSPDTPFLAIGILPHWGQMPYYGSLTHPHNLDLCHLIARSPKGCFGFTAAAAVGHTNTGTCKWDVDFFLISNEAGRARFLQPNAEALLHNALTDLALQLQNHALADDRARFYNTAHNAIQTFPYAPQQPRRPTAALVDRPPARPRPPAPDAAAPSCVSRGRGPCQARLAAIDRILHAEGLRRYGPTVDIKAREEFLRKRAPAVPPLFYADSTNNGPMSNQPTLQPLRHRCPTPKSAIA